MSATRPPWTLPLLALVLLAGLAGGGYWLLGSGGASPAPAEDGPLIIPDEAETSPKPPPPAQPDEPGGGGDPIDESLPPAQPSEAAARRALVKGLRQRFSEPELKTIAQGSVSIEDAARAQYGDSEMAYEKMAEGWAEHCKKFGITEAERDALEDEAIRKGW